MKKSTLFTLFIFTICLGVKAQYSNDDVRIINVSFEGSPAQVKLSQKHSLHNQVIFRIDKAGHPYTVVFNPGNGTSPITLTSQIQDVVVTYPSSATNMDYTISFELFLGILVTEVLTIKGNSSVGNIGYTPPDEVWAISTAATFQPPIADAYPAGNPYNGDAVGSAHAYIRFAPGHNGRLLKPLIFVDGIDFNANTYSHNGEVIRHGSTGWDVLFMGNDASEPNIFETDGSEFSGYPAAFNLIQASPNDYDIVFLDFGNGADYIQKNGLLLIELIKRINTRKAQDAETSDRPFCDNVVLGASMGGQVAKWALSYMEENSMNHQTHTYVSFDSPQRGAHIPLSLQAFALLADRAEVNPERWNSLNTPAARQMLLLHLGGEISIGRSSALFSRDLICSDPSTWDVPTSIDLEYPHTFEMRQGFANTMQTLGYPQQTRNIGISCGTSNGTPQGIGTNGVLFESGLDLGNNPLAGFCTNNPQLGFAFYSLLNTANGSTPGSKSVFHLNVCQSSSFQFQNKTLFAGFMPKFLISFSGNDVPCKYNYLRVTANATYPNFDNASGCSRTDTKGLRKDMEGFGVPVLAASDKFSFMPTISTLDIQWPMDDDHLTDGIDLLEVSMWTKLISIKIRIIYGQL